MYLILRIKHSHIVLSFHTHIQYRHKEPPPSYNVAVLGQDETAGCCRGQKLKESLPPLLCWQLPKHPAVVPAAQLIHKTEPCGSYLLVNYSSWLHGRRALTCLEGRDKGRLVIFPLDLGDGGVTDLFAHCCITIFWSSSDSSTLEDHAACCP